MNNTDLYYIVREIKDIAKNTTRPFTFKQLFDEAQTRIPTVAMTEEVIYGKVFVPMIKGQFVAMVGKIEGVESDTPLYLVKQ